MRGTMKTAAIIAEYNPFHNGHAYHIQETRRQTGADYIVAIMSGDYVQRGAPALFDKYRRTQMALLGGADLVFELPVRYALSSAEGFAEGGASLADALQSIDYLSFGSECGSLSELEEAAVLFFKESKEYGELIKEYRKAGLSYPAARQKTVERLYPKNAGLQSIVTAPNNILALEYCLALKRSGSPILPFTVMRKGSGYHDQEMASGCSFNSATAIRSSLEDTAAVLASIPEAIHPCFLEARQNGCSSPDDFSHFLYYRLLSEDRRSLRTLYEITPELAGRMKRLSAHAMSLTEFASKLKTRQYTRTRIDRVLMRLILNIGEASGRPVPYARLLGMKKTAVPLLKRIQDNSGIPVIKKLTKAPSLLSPQALACLEDDIHASELYRLALEYRTGLSIKSEYSRGMVILP